MQRPMSFSTRKGGLGSHDNRPGRVSIAPADCAPKRLMDGTERITFGVNSSGGEAMDFLGSATNADELSSYSSVQNSLEASWNGSSYPYRFEANPNHHHHHHHRQHRHVLTPPSPSREHIPKRPRFAVDGLNVVESLFHNIFSSCGCVQSAAMAQQQNQNQQQQPTQQYPGNGFASKPLGLHHEPYRNLDRANRHSVHIFPQSSSNSKTSGNTHQPAHAAAVTALPDPPKVRRLTMQEASNDLDVAFMMR